MTVLPELRAQLVAGMARGPRRRRVEPLAAAVAAVIALSGAAYGVIQLDGSGTEREQPAVAPPAPAWLGSFPALRQPQVGVSELPRSIRERARGATEPGAAVFRAGSHIGPLWVIVDPQRATVCLWVPTSGDGFGGTCQTATDALAGRLVSTLVLDGRAGDPSALVAVLPEGSREATLTAAGETRRIAIENGVLAVTARQPSTVSFRVGDEVRTLRLPTG